MKQNLLYSLTRYLNFFKNLFIVLFIWAIKEAVTRLSFSCPCLTDSGDWWTSKDARQIYGSLYIAAPAAIFWIIGLFLNSDTWRCITGWRVQEKFVYPGRSCWCFFHSLTATALAPITWMFLLFLDGRYLECIEATTPAVCQLPGADDSESRKLYMISQVTACVMASVCFILYFLGSVLFACCGGMTYYQLKHAHHVQDIEEETFYQASLEFHTAEMKKKWKTLFAAGSSSDWDCVSELPPGDPIKRTKRTFYTPFQNWQGTITPKETMRDSDPVHTNMVTIVVKSSDSRALVEVDKGQHVWTTTQDKNGHHRGRNLPVLPPLTSSVTSYSNGHPVYLGPSDKDAEKHSRSEDPSFHSNVQTSTPKVKKKKIAKKKNKVDNSDE